MARVEIERDVFTVIRHLQGWAVEHDGEIHDASRDKEEAKAAASRRARAAASSGRLCQIRIIGEHGFLAN